MFSSVFIVLWSNSSEWGVLPLLMWQSGLIELESSFVLSQNPPLDRCAVASTCMVQVNALERSLKKLKSKRKQLGYKELNENKTKSLLLF